MSTPTPSFGPSGQLQPNWPLGYVPAVAEWETWWAGKQDSLGVSNALAFGATGDGTTDDTTALQTAISSFGASGGTLLLPPGVYKISAALTIPAACPLNIIGAGASATKILQTNGEANGLQFYNAASAFWTGGSVRGLTLAASLTAGVVGSTGTGIVLQSANDVFVGSDIYIVGFGTGLLLEGCWNTRWQHVTIQTNLYTGINIGQDPSFPTTGGNLFSNCLVTNYGSTGGGSPNGVAIYQSGGEYFDSVEVDSYNIGWLIAPAASKIITYLFFTACLADSCKDIGWFFNGNTSAIFSVTCVNCWSSFSTNEGLLVQGAEATTIRWLSGRLRENGAAGAVIDGAFYTTISDSEICGNGRGATAGEYPGILVTAGTSQFMIQGNYCGNFGSAYLAQGSAVYIAVGASTDFMVLGNASVQPAGGATAFYNGSTASSSTYVVTNNLAS